jgi:alanine-glyoxylate transaminase/serine-glyoxylate transaminase/serine-pyruvate transaminase
MEMCFVNMIDPGDKVIVCRNGVFGGRMIENVQRCGGTAVVVDDRWGTPVDPQKVADALKANPDAKIVAFVHAETSTGRAIRREDAGRARAEARSRSRSWTRSLRSRGTPVADRRVGQSTRSIRRARSACPCTPGLSPVSFSDRVVEMVKKRQRKSAQLVHGHESAARILGRRQSHLPPHGADQLAL